MLIFWFIALFIAIEIVLHLLINKLRDEFSPRVDWHKGRLITNIITVKDKVPLIDKRGLYKFVIHFYDPELGSVTKPNSSNIEKHQKANGEVVTTSYNINSLGSRVNPGYEDLPINISCFGDSITFCRHVNDDQTWQHYLSQFSGDNVANFAVGNYGVDQAFLRFKREAKKGLAGSTVLIGVAPETIRRSLSCWKHYFEFGNIYNFKPRFRLNQGKLELISNFIDKLEKYSHLKEHLGSIANKDFFYEEKFKKYLLKFPYSASILKNPVRKGSLLFYYTMTYFSELLGKDWTKTGLFAKKGKIMNGIKKFGGLHFDFQDKLKYYQEKEIVGLTAAIIKEFAGCIRSYGKTPYLVILPTKGDLEHIKSTKNIYYQSLKTETEKFIKVLDVADNLIKVEDLDQVFSDCGYGAHYNHSGNELVAKAIFNFIKIDERKLEATH